VVDDGSADDTVEQPASPARVSSPAANRGKGAALKAGFERRSAALSTSLERHSHSDGDGQHDPAEAPAFGGLDGIGADLVWERGLQTDAAGAMVHQHLSKLLFSWPWGRRS